MKVCCLASGSKGNATYVETEDLRILIDCGLGIKDIEKRLAVIGVEAKSIELILITHEHQDHIKGLEPFLQKYEPKVYVPPYCFEAIAGKMKKTYEFRLFMEDFIHYQNTLIYPLHLSHDSEDCFGYTIICPSGKMSIATDTGTIGYEQLKVMGDSDVTIIESNHNNTLLMNNPNYPVVLKRRILSEKGHLSNGQCADYVYKLSALGCRQFVLAHLSEENNTPKLAYMDIAEALIQKHMTEGVDYYLDIALQNQVGTLYEIKTDEN